MSMALDIRRDCGTPVFVSPPSATPRRDPTDDVWLEKVHDLLAGSPNGLSLKEVKQQLRVARKGANSLGRNGNEIVVQAIHHLTQLGLIVSKRSKSASGRGRRTYHALSKGGAA